MENLSYDEWNFKKKLDVSLREVKKILDTSRHPELAGDVHHSYKDKYCLSEYLTNTAMAALMNVLSSLGINDEKLSVLVDWAKNGHSVWLEFEGKETCEFLREQVREEKISKKNVTESQLFGKSTNQVVTTIKEYFYKVTLNYNLVAKCSGKDPLSLTSRKGSMEIKTTAKEAPRPKQQSFERFGCSSPDITFLLKQLNNAGEHLAFTIDRSDVDKCRTPLRNPDIEAAVKFFEDFGRWSKAYFVNLTHFMQTCQEWQGENQPRDDLSQISSDSLFVPVLPLFEDKTNEGDNCHAEGPRAGSKIAKLSKDESDFTFNLSDTNSFLEAQKKSIDEKFGSLSKIFLSEEEKAGLVTSWEAKVMVGLSHCNDICQQYRLSIAYIENMIYKQLVAAIGKEITPKEFEKYMRFHEKRLFHQEYAPVPFCYAVRRPKHYPEGTVAIEEINGDPIHTMTRFMPEEDSVPMSFKINAATNVTFNGDRYLHAFVANKFGHQPGIVLQLVAHARQFSCFMLLLGRIGPGNTFEPKHAILLENKDDLKIPILLEQLPTPKEFKDAIESLSPEQQKFAKAYRSMQLEGTVFGLLTIQLKPQLEKLLKLPENSLTKEIKLTQDLLRLFIEYQIPSDLLSFEGDNEAELQTKLEAVKGHVKAIMDMLESTQKAQLEEAAQGYLQEKLEKREEEFDCLERDGVPQMMAMSDSRGGGGFSFGMGSAPPPPPPAAAPGGLFGGFGGAQKKSAAPRFRSAAPAYQRNSLLNEVSMGAPPPPPPSFGATKQQQQITIASTSTKSDGPVHQSEAVSEQVKQPLRQLSSTNKDESTAMDFTKVPSTLDTKFEKLDTDSALRPTIINVGEKWGKRSLKSLRGKPVEKSLWPKEQDEEKTRCYDLLDALSCSGSLEIDCASLHVVVAATHCFDESIVNTIVQNNINPIEKVERSILIVGSTIQGKPPGQLIKPANLAQIESHSPQLLNEANEEAKEQ